jgi:hypothetical protein
VTGDAAGGGLGEGSEDGGAGAALFDEVFGGVGDLFELEDSAAADGRGELGGVEVEPGADVGALGPAAEVEEGFG